MFEKIPAPESQEFSEQESRIVLLLKEKGPEDPETKEALNSWLDAEELKVAEENSISANIEFSLKQAKLYAAAGFAEEALQNAEAAMLEAANCGESDLWDKAKEVCDRVRS